MLRLIVVLCFCSYWPGPVQLKEQDSSERIVGGIDADIEDFPYQISMQYNGRHTCGGSILSSNIIVTAAHCTDGANVTRMSIRAGSRSHSEGGVVVKVEEILQHPHYNDVNIDYDISVLKLKDKLNFSDVIKPIKTSDKDIGSNHFAVVTGWGTLKETGTVSKNLQQVFVPLMKDEDCKRFYGEEKITDRMMCAGYVEGGHDSCQGDSGGPLAYKDKLIGIVSWGIGCARPNYPGVYTHVPRVRSYLRTFIDL